MTQVTGTLKSIGPSMISHASMGTASVTVYSYLEIGGQVLKKVRLFSRGLEGPLHSGLAGGATVTLYLQHGVLIGVGLPDGKIWVAQGVMWFPYLLMGTLVFVFGLPFLLGGLWTLAALFVSASIGSALIGIASSALGFVMVRSAWRGYWVPVWARIVARTIPNGIVV